jgi:hypothetical protein
VTAASLNLGFDIRQRPVAPVAGTGRFADVPLISINNGPQLFRACSYGWLTGLVIKKTPQQRRYAMKTGIFFTGTGPILILTTYGELNDPTLVEKLSQKGIKKFIAYEVPENMVKEKYGQQFNIILGDLKQSDDLRVLDYDGHHVFYNFALSDLGEPVYYEGGVRVLRAG